MPVIILTDQHLASSYATVEPFDLSRVQIRRGDLSPERNAARLEQLQRYEISPSGYRRGPSLCSRAPWWSPTLMSTMKKAT